MVIDKYKYMYDHYKKKCLSFLRLQKYPDRHWFSRNSKNISIITQQISNIQPRLEKNFHHYLNLVNKSVTESETKFQQLYDLSLPDFRRTDKKQICTSPGKSTVIFSIAGATTSWFSGPLTGKSGPEDSQIPHSIRDSHMLKGLC